MKRTTIAILAITVLAMGAIVVAQERKPDEHKLIQFHMALLKKGPKYDAAGMSQDLKAQHIGNVLSLIASGKAVIAGPFADDSEIAGVLIFRARSAEEAREWAENDPAVKAGFFVAEMHPWWSEDVMKKANTPIQMTTAYLGFLKRGAKWTAEKTPATEAIQKAHLANIGKLADTKKLVIAGPFGDNGDLRGIFVFKVASIEEAKQLAETDPAVQAGRLEIEMHPWMVPDGVLP